MAKQVDFGFEKVSADEKLSKVEAVFSSVSEKYDLMNDVMSLGLHRIWKRLAINIANLKKGEKVLDMASGTGDLARLVQTEVGNDGQVVMGDFNIDMLSRGRNLSIDKGMNLPSVSCNAQNLPFKSEHFDCVTIAFGLRNMVDKAEVIREAHRVLCSGGRLIILEFSKVYSFLQPFYKTYLFKVVPKLGKLLVNDEDSYRYLAESIEMHPSQSEIVQLFTEAGFENNQYYNFTGGVVAVHLGYKVD